MFLYDLSLHIHAQIRILLHLISRNKEAKNKAIPLSDFPCYLSRYI